MQYLSKSLSLRLILALGATMVWFALNGASASAQTTSAQPASAESATSASVAPFTGNAKIVTRPDGVSYVQVGNAMPAPVVNVPAVTQVSLFKPDSTPVATYSTPAPPRRPSKFKRLIFAAGIVTIATAAYLAFKWPANAKTTSTSDSARPRPIAGIIIGSRTQVVDQPTHIPGHPWYS